MLQAIAKRFAIWLAFVVYWTGHRAHQLGCVVSTWSAQDIFRWQHSLSLRLSIAGVALFVAIQTWDLDRLQVDGPTSDRWLKDVLIERSVNALPEPQPSWAKPGNHERFRCVVPFGASAEGLSPYLNPAAFSSARVWIETSLPGLGSDWWMVDAIDGRISKMSRMDKAVLQPHPRMKEAQCVPANAMKFINSGVNARGVQEFQVMDLSRSAAY